MKRRVVVTGIGTVTSLSRKVDDLWQRLLRGESGVHPLRAFDTSQHKVKFGGDIYDWSADGYIDRKEEKRLDRFTQFALVAGIDAVNDSGLDFAKEDPFRCGVAFGSGIGGLNEFEEQHDRYRDGGPSRISPFVIPKMIANSAAGNISIQFGLAGHNSVISTACSSAAQCIADALRAIQWGYADVMVAGASEAGITPMGLGGFISARAVSDRNHEPTKASRPWDKPPPAKPSAQSPSALRTSTSAALSVLVAVESMRSSSLRCSRLAPR